MDNYFHREYVIMIILDCQFCVSSTSVFFSFNAIYCIIFIITVLAVGLEVQSPRQWFHLIQVVLLVLVIAYKLFRHTFSHPALLHLCVHPSCPIQEDLVVIGAYHKGPRSPHHLIKQPVASMCFHQILPLGAFLRQRIQYLIDTMGGKETIWVLSH